MNKIFDKIMDISYDMQSGSCGLGYRPTVPLSVHQSVGDCVVVVDCVVDVLGVVVVGEEVGVNVLVDVVVVVVVVGVVSSEIKVGIVLMSSKTLNLSINRNFEKEKEKRRFFFVSATILNVNYIN